MRNRSERELPAFLAAHVSPTLRAWVRHFARGSDGMRVGGAAPDRGLTASKRGESHQ